jgi:phosphoribosylpyrophosphate synthetase
MWLAYGNRDCIADNGQAIRRVHHGESISVLFDYN